MAKKNVVVTFNHAPHGAIFYTEGLRAAVGLISGIDEHQVEVIYLGDGVYYALKDVDLTDTQKYLETLKKTGTSFYVESQSLLERGINEEEISPEFSLIKIEEISNIINRSDFTIAF